MSCQLYKVYVILKNTKRKSMFKTACKLLRNQKQVAVNS